MKIALLQLNPVIGDFTANTNAILHWAARAAASGARLAILPELAVSGYPPQDYLEQGAFLDQQDAAIARLQAELPISVLVGAITRADGPGKPLYNAALLISEGEIIFTSHKKLLPTYDVFDESRYFRPGRNSQFVSFHGLNLGVTICEDIFNDADAFPDQPYGLDPVAILHENEDIDLLINIAASPFTMGKIHQRQHDFAIIARKYGTPLLYCNQVGGQDSIIFDGSSMVLDSQGRLCGQAASFAEDMLLLETDHLQPVARPQPDDNKQVMEALTLGCRDYVRKCGFEKVVLGLSGGIDSALTCAIACRALGPENVMAIALPSPYSSEGSLRDARRLADNLGVSLATLPISEPFAAINATLEGLFSGLESDVTEQNIQARIRGLLLMAVANKFNRLLLTTGNKSEMAVGYCTLYGDMNGALAVIADVPKTLVFALCRWLNEEKAVIPTAIINKPPSAELAPNQLDQDDLPPYDILDTILTAYLEKQQSMAQIIAQGQPEPLVRDVIGRIRRNEYKRQQAAPGLKVTSKAFGPGRRIPIAARFRE